MREIVFDTETTGLDNRADRIIEIGGIELVNKFPTGRSFHEYINPEGRAVHPEALAVHGIGDEQLAGKPPFREVAARFVEFIDGATLVAHNATFDIAFVNAELERLGHPLVGLERVIDTLAIAKRKQAGKKKPKDAMDETASAWERITRRMGKRSQLVQWKFLKSIYPETVRDRLA